MVTIFLVLLLATTPISALTLESTSTPSLEMTAITAEVTTTSSVETFNVGKFWQEFDITFWQSLPFTALWGHFFERQAAGYLYPGVAARWDVILTLAVITSAGNAWLHASAVKENERKRHNH